MVVTLAPPGVGSEGREQCWGAGEVHLKSVQPQPLQTPPSAPLVPDWEGAEFLHGGGGGSRSPAPPLCGREMCCPWGLTSFLPVTPQPVPVYSAVASVAPGLLEESRGHSLEQRHLLSSV